MAFASWTTHSIHVKCKRVFDNEWLQTEGEVPSGGLASEPHLLLRLRCVIDVNNREIRNTTVTSRHSFINCIQSNLQSLMQNTEPLPMNFLMENEEAEMTRLRISHTIECEARNCSRVEGLKGIIVQVIVKVYVIEREEEVASILGEMRMASVKRNLYMGGEETGSTSSTTVGVCAVCLEDMVEGGNEVISTPFAEMTRVRMANQAHNCIGVVGLNELELDIALKVFRE
ncbi:hypothetical protein KFK09_024712 [Dendrobium nobile]|uniref:Uncharacterized protein n=1 Tax=Dendrobium nobile TaxID=94219 RepID=A0A8T3AFK1_DENNO|nr:hypothetical protein KFK09_024712 [Dendrobium nobile]